MNQALTPKFKFLPTPEAAHAFDEALNVLADALADVFLERARAEIALEYGLEFEASCPMSESMPQDLEELLCPQKGGRR